MWCGRIPLCFQQPSMVALDTTNHASLIAKAACLKSRDMVGPEVEVNPAFTWITSCWAVGGSFDFSEGALRYAANAVCSMNVRGDRRMFARWRPSMPLSLLGRVVDGCWWYQDWANFTNGACHWSKLVNPEMHFRKRVPNPGWYLGRRSQLWFPMKWLQECVPWNYPEEAVQVSSHDDKIAAETNCQILHHPSTLSVESNMAGGIFLWVSISGNSNQNAGTKMLRTPLNYKNSQKRMTSKWLKNHDR